MLKPKFILKIVPFDKLLVVEINYQHPNFLSKKDTDISYYSEINDYKLISASQVKLTENSLYMKSLDEQKILSDAMFFKTNKERDLYQNKLINSIVELTLNNDFFTDINPRKTTKEFYIESNNNPINFTLDKLKINHSKNINIKDLTFKKVYHISDSSYSDIGDMILFQYKPKKSKLQNLLFIEERKLNKGSYLSSMFFIMDCIPKKSEYLSSVIINEKDKYSLVDLKELEIDEFISSFMKEYENGRIYSGEFIKRVNDTYEFY